MATLGQPWQAPGGKSRTRPHSNLVSLRIAVVALFMLLTAQLFRMQIIDGRDYARRAEENHIAVDTILAARGSILDAEGNPLVVNVPLYEATIIPDFLPKNAEKRDAIYLEVERITGVPALEVREKVKSAESDRLGYIGISLATNLTKGQALTLDEASIHMPGVSLAIRPGRDYPAGPEFAHILGYIGKQTREEYAELRSQNYALNEPVGKAGIELYYEQELRGQRGGVAAEQDAQGTLVRALGKTDPVPGNSVRLGINANLQKYIYQLLDDHLKGDDKNRDARVAAAVVMDAKTGLILAIVSYPSFDNNLFGKANNDAAFNELINDARKPLLNQALTPSAPGSTFKLVTAAAGLQTGNITPASGVCVTSKVLEIKGENGVIYPFYDWREHGCINLNDGIAWSSNVYFYMTSCGIPGYARGLGKDPETSAVVLGYYARQFGFGQNAGIDIGGESPGTVPDPAWKRRVHADDNPEDREWYYADTCFMGIGQGDVSASPLQVARMTAAVANGGKLLKPHVAKDIISPTGKVVRTIEPEWTQVPVDARNLATIREGMHSSVIYGAGLKAGRSSVDIAGKTGTAEFFLKSGEKAQHAWFTGYAPFNDPEIVVTVYFDIGVGGEKAAPIAGQIFDYYWQEVRGR